MAYGDGIPQGWRECTCMGDPFYNFIPMKTPIGNPKLLQHLQPHQLFTPNDALEMATARIHSQPAWSTTRDGHAMNVGAVLDLTNSKRYYDPADFTSRGVYHIKVPCRGRGQSPDPAAVNAAVWELRKVLQAYPTFYVLVHCTHGYNRTGYIIVSALMRFLAGEGMCVERALRRFTVQRPPGIYKDDYIQDLFRYHHERRPPHIAPAEFPEWKAAASPPDEEEQREAQERETARLAEETAPKHHDDIMGELIPREEEEYIQRSVSYSVLQQSGINMNAVRFPGSQPVSLDRQNMSLIQQKRYYMTWKADGTRYMLLATHFGVYLIDRSNRVRRIQMRFPTMLPDEKRKGAPYPVGPPHMWTLLDGEMVVDAEDGNRQRRRYLVYDIMLLNKLGVMNMRFEDRFQLIYREVEAPRRKEGEWVKLTSAKQPAYPFLYEYDREPFSVRRKDFWPLTQAEKVLERFIPALCHESDGLILQSWDDPYIPQTCPTLLKWKFAHLNSVDFLLAPPAAGQHEPQLLLMHKGAKDLKPLKGARISFPADANPAAFYDRIVECVWDAPTGTWKYLRERVDKDTPNHINTYNKVWGSIQDNIQDKDVLAAFSEALRMAQYGPDVNPQLAQQQQHHHQHHQQQQYHQQQQHGMHGGHMQQQHYGQAPPQHGQHPQHMQQRSHQQQPQHPHQQMQQQAPHHLQQQQYHQHQQQQPPQHQQQQHRHGPPSARSNGAGHTNGVTHGVGSPQHPAAAADGNDADPDHAEDAEAEEEEQCGEQEEEEANDAGGSPGSHATDDDLDAGGQVDGPDAMDDDYKFTEAASASEEEEEGHDDGE